MLLIVNTRDKVCSAISILLKPAQHTVNSITYDNGKEFARYEQANNAIGCKSYFATLSLLGARTKREC